MSKCIEINYNCSKLADFIRNLKSEFLTIIIKAGGSRNSENCCCVQRGYFCKLNHNLIQLFNKEKNSKIYIPLDAVAAIIISEECTTQEENNTDKNSENEIDKDNAEIKDSKEQQDTDISQEEEVEVSDDLISERRVYGYGRKINIDFLKKKNDFIVTEINITELSLSTYSLEIEKSFIYYFHKDGINDRAIELLVSPSSPGKIEEIITNRAKTKAIIKGQGIVHIDSENKGECEFKLLVTKNRALIKIIEGNEVLERHDKELVGVCEQENKPFSI
ncbi:hypothetical protein [Halanaerobacter jeridensis]|uniref:Uncharacterized protein n=1 Tax=Halanaerobacter jeridensis TaxID=706427 RepID=A0A939BMI7_9FIRM|nr:hypothetical protein [Halanaerobacter jeridensis]MBM7556610.1 hypothetical protein [Halanaerobacter jeridensis]